LLKLFEFANSSSFPGHGVGISSGIGQYVYVMPHKAEYPMMLSSFDANSLKHAVVEN